MALGLAIPLLWGRVVHLHDMVLFVIFYLVSGFGVTVGYHRLFTHRGFTPTRTLKIVLAGAGSLAMEGSLIGWVANHRKHHAFSDRPGDPHSPHDERDGFAAPLRGFFHAHIGWLFRANADLGRALRAGSRERRRRRHHQPPVPALRGVLARGPVLPRLGVDGNDRRRAHGTALGRRGAHDAAASRDLERELDLSHVRQAAGDRA